MKRSIGRKMLSAGLTTLAAGSAIAFSTAPAHAATGSESVLCVQVHPTGGPVNEASVAMRGAEPNGVTEINVRLAYSSTTGDYTGCAAGAWTGAVSLTLSINGWQISSATVDNLYGGYNTYIWPVEVPTPDPGHYIPCPPSC